MDAMLDVSLVSAAEESERRKKSLNLLNTHVSGFGFKVSNNVPYDGNCFFHAVCCLLERTESDAKELRQELVTFLKTKPKVCAIHSLKYGMIKTFF